MNFGVTFGLLTIVRFSTFDRSKDALKHGFWCFFGDSVINPKTRVLEVFGPKITNYCVQNPYSR